MSWEVRKCMKSTGSVWAFVKRVINGCFVRCFKVSVRIVVLIFLGSIFFEREWSGYWLIVRFFRVWGSR